MHESISSSVWTDFLNLLESSQRFLVSSHINPDGDAIGSALAFKGILEKLGKDVKWVMDDHPGDMFAPFYDVRDIEIYDPQITSWEDREVAVMLDAPFWKRMGNVGEAMEKLPAKKLCIDHHECSETFQGVKISDTEAPSTTVIVYRIAQQLGLELTLDLAEPIYLGLIVDTQNFHLPNTTIESHYIAADCLRAGVKPFEVYEPVFGTTSFARMRLMSETFHTVQVLCDGKVGLMYTSREMFKKCGAKKADDEGFSDMVRTIKGVRVGIYIRELEDGRVKVSWRGKGDNNVEMSARYFGGGGHFGAAGSRLNYSLNEAIQLVSEEITERCKRGEIE